MTSSVMAPWQAMRRGSSPEIAAGNIPLAKGGGHGTDNTCTSTTSHGGGGEEVVQAGRYCGGGRVWHRKNLVVFVDVVGVVSARRNDESLPRLSACCSRIRGGISDGSILGALDS